MSWGSHIWLADYLGAEVSDCPKKAHQIQYVMLREKRVNDVFLKAALGFMNTTVRCAQDFLFLPIIFYKITFGSLPIGLVFKDNVGYEY